MKKGEIFPYTKKTNIINDIILTMSLIISIILSKFILITFFIEYDKLLSFMVLTFIIMKFLYNTSMEIYRHFYNRKKR